MAHFSKVWPAGLTDGVSTLPHGDLETIDTNLAKAINGDDGGAWAPGTTSIDIGGKGLSRSFKSATWDDFAADPTAKRTIVRRGIFQPLRVFVGGALTSYGILQGQGVGVMATSILREPTDHATLTKLRVYFQTATGRGSLPAVGPGIDVSRYDPSAAPPVAASLSTTGAQFYTLPGLLATYEAAGTKTMDFVPDTLALLDRTTYHYLVAIYDESGGGAIFGNLFFGYEATWTLDQWRP